MAIFNGLAYVADDAAGLQVINYLAYDAKGAPPTTALAPAFCVEGVQERTPLSVSANVSDDVQVGQVEFFLDGTNVFTHGSFPFEFRFEAPARSTTKTHFTLRARTVDTGGNSSLSTEMTVPLVPDTTPIRTLQP